MEPLIGGAGVDDSRDDSTKTQRKHTAKSKRNLLEREEMFTEFLSLFNGDWTRGSRVVHYCNGCCPNKEVTILRCARALKKVVFAKMPTIPSVINFLNTISGEAWGKIS